MPATPVLPARTPRLPAALGVALAVLVAAWLALAPAARAAGNPQTWLVAVTPSDDETNQPVTRFTFGGDADVVGYECRLAPAPWAPCANPWTITVPDGLQSFWFRGVDRDGAVEQDPLEWRWLVDTTALAPAIAEAPPARTHATSARVVFSGEERATFECSLDGAPFAACASPFEPSGLAVGDHALDVRQRDRLGNVSPAARVAWTVAPAPPAPVPDRPQEPSPRPRPAAPRRPAAAVPTRATIAAPARTTAPAGRLNVGCAVNRGPVRRCAFDVLLGGRRAGGGAAAFRGRGGRGAVALRLDARARRAVARPGGATVRLRLRARGATGGALVARTTVRLLPPRALAVPSTGMFATGSSRLLPAGARFLRGVAPDLVHARTVRCTGHTDAQGAEAANRALGLARARAVCAALRAAGVRRARTTAATAGEARPRATNRTAAGRALNRRVELAVRY